MSYFLFLDDFRQPRDAFNYTKNILYTTKNWLVVRSYNEFVKCIEENGVPHTISFDHDLADAHYEEQETIAYDKYIEKTGYHCATWLIKYCIDNKLKLPTAVLIHSMNPVGSQNIRSIFDNYHKVMNLPS